jgi:hypothetical protein
MWARTLVVLEELDRRGIPVMVLKSLPQMEELYGHAGARVSADVDLLVPARAMRPATETILQLGWSMTNRKILDLLPPSEAEAELSLRPWHFYKAVDGEPCLLDLHSDGMPAWLRPVLDPAIWAHARTLERDGVTFLVPGYEDRLLFLCWHFFSDARGDGFPWLKLEDIHIILARDPLDWPRLSRRAREAGVALFLHLACDLVAGLATEPIEPVWRERVPNPAPRRYALLRWIVTRRADRLSDRGRLLLWLLAYDRVRDIRPEWRHVIAPSRLTIAADYLGYWPSWPRYVLQLLAIYAHRVSATFVRVRRSWMTPTRRPGNPDPG